MLTRKVQSVRDCLLVSIPRQLSDMMEIEKGAVMRIECIDDKIIYTPVRDAVQATQRTGGVHKHPKLREACNV